MTAPTSSHAGKLDPPTMTRLAFVRLLFQQGIDASQLPEPLNTTSVLSLHDASELLLGTIADHIDASLPKNATFMDHWRLLSPNRLSRGIELPARQRMDRVNELRIAFKHKGIMPSKTAIELSCTDVKAFLEDTITLVFGLDFASINMAGVIPQPSTRELVNAATAAAASGDLREAMGLLGEAFEELFNHDGREPRSFAAFGESVSQPVSEIDIGRMLSTPREPGKRPPPDVRPLARQIATTTKAAQEMQRGLRVMALGIDFRQFARFQKLTPYIARFVGGGKDRFTQPGYDPTREEFDYCCQFMVTVALRLAELDLHAAQPEWWPGR